MEISKKILNLRVLPLLYPKFVQIFQIGLKYTINFQGLASFWNKMIVFKYFFKKFSIKLVFFYWFGVTSKNGPKVKKGSTEGKKMTLNLEQHKF